MANESSSQTKILKFNWLYCSFTLFNMINGFKYCLEKFVCFLLRFLRTYFILLEWLLVIFAWYNLYPVCYLLIEAYNIYCVLVIMIIQILKKQTTGSTHFSSSVMISIQYQISIEGVYCNIFSSNAYYWCLNIYLSITCLVLVDANLTMMQFTMQYHHLAKSIGK